METRLLSGIRHRPSRYFIRWYDTNRRVIFLREKSALYLCDLQEKDRLDVIVVPKHVILQLKEIHDMSSYFQKQ